MRCGFRFIRFAAIVKDISLAACCVEPHGWCVVTSIGLKQQLGYDRAVLLIQTTTVRISNS